jgi:hypothetical protein
LVSGCQIQHLQNYPCEYADAFKLVTPENPDLMIIGFGMNDGSI